VPRRFDIVENPNTRQHGLYPLLLVLQHDRVTSVDSVIVAPLVPVDRGPERGRLHPIVEADGQQYVVLIEDLASMPRNRLTHVLGSAEAQHYEIIAALDMLFTGI
jgi:toxin CcdB